MKNLFLILLLLLIISCSKTDQDYVESCADSLTAKHWQERQMMYERNLENAKKLKNKAGIKINERRAKLYKNYAKKSLQHKLGYNIEFYDNFKKCENEFKKNPILFKARFK